MRRFRDRGLQNQHFSIFFSTGSKPIWSLKRRPKNHSKILPKRISGAPEKWTPLFGASSRQPWTEHRDVIFNDPYQRNAPWAFQKRPEGLPRIATTPKYGVQNRLQARNYRALISRRINMKNDKTADPCQRSATSLISGDARKSLLSQKKLPFCTGGVVQTENHRVFMKAHIRGDIFENCKDVSSIITIFAETDGKDTACTWVKVTILHSRILPGNNLNISRPRPKNRSRSLPGSYFQGFPGPGPTVAP